MKYISVFLAFFVALPSLILAGEMCDVVFVQNWTWWITESPRDCYESLRNVDRTIDYFPLAVDVEAMHAEAAERGYRIIWTDSLVKYMHKYKEEGLKPPAAIVFWWPDGALNELYPFIESLNTKLIFYIYDSLCIVPMFFDPENHVHYTKVYTWKDDLVDDKRYFKFWYPVLFPMDETLPSFEERKLVTQISSDSSLIDEPNQLYTERLRVIQFFEKNTENDFEFYGNAWKRGKYRNYRGRVADKNAALKKYRFSFCYENCKDTIGYVTEKIFDCFRAGTIPIYWGASNIEEYVPKNCFIDRRDFKSTKEVYAFIKAITKEEYEEYIHNIRQYLTSEKAHLFSSEHFVKTFLDGVDDNTSSQ